jgi:sugar phosphate isomerase/epimerase
MIDQKRRKHIQQMGLGMAGLGLLGFSACTSTEQKNNANTGDNPEVQSSELFFKISLAQWSLHNAFGSDGISEAIKKGQQPDFSLSEMHPIAFPEIAKNQFGIDAIELVNRFYWGKTGDMEYLSEFKQRCEDNDVKCLLIMCDDEGSLGDLDQAARVTAVENHYKWIDTAKYLGCHSIRVNAAGSGTAEEVQSSAIDGLGRLSEYGQQAGINVIVENHGGYSSDGQWLSKVISEVNNPFCGTLPDFGNFCIKGSIANCENEYDRYKGTEELMPFAKGVSAKSNVFDAEGNEKNIDYLRLLQIVKDSGYSGYIGIEFEGDELSEKEGILATKKLLETAGRKVS